MQALKRTLQTIASQLKGLTPTARLLTGSLVIIMMMSLFLVSLYAGRAEMVPLGLKPNVSPSAKAQAIDYLKMRDIAYEDHGSDLLVPVEHKFTLLAHLTENQLIDGDQIDFDALVADDSPFRTRDQNRQRYLVAKMNVLSGMIGQMTDIESARVVLDQAESLGGIGRSHVPPSASVSVRPRGTELSQTQVDAIAQLVARAQAGLKAENVAVIDSRTGRAMHARTEEMVSAGKYMEVKLNAEKHARSTLESALGYIPGVRIAVNAQVDAKEVTQNTHSFDEPKIGVTQEDNRTINSEGPVAAAEPGVRPNIGANITSASRQGPSLSDERTETSSVPAFGKKESQIRDARGYALQINATIGVPRSYFIQLYQQNQADEGAAPPDAAALDALVQAETEKLRKYVTPLIDTGANEGAVAGAVAVSMIPDFAAQLVSLDAPAGGSGGGGGFAEGPALDGALVKYVSLGGLALLSVAMMFMMVRRASVRQDLPTAAELVGIPPALAAAESDLVGEADEASPALEGLELTDDAMRRQQMLDQISQMISTTPDDAAGLLRRWIKSEA